jgi:MGT family glycosyltransferase
MVRQTDNPAKIIFMNVPAQGHINPTLAVVAELVRRHIEVIYYNTEEFRSSIEPTGAVFRPYPPPVPNAAQISEAVDKSVINFAVMIFQTSEHLTGFMLEEIRREQPDLIVYDATCLWGKQASLLSGVPGISSISTFVLEGAALKLNWRDYLCLLGGALTNMPQFMVSRYRLRKRYGADSLPPGPIFPARGGLNIVYTSRELQPETAFVDDTFRFVGPAIDPLTRVVDFPFEQVTRHPLVYISFGTVHNMNPHFYQACFEAFADHPGQVILSVGRRTAIESLGKAPSNFMVRNSAPQLKILQQCDVFITHGGMNSFQEALYYGVPMVLVPYQFEQLVNARVVAAIGAGVIANEKPPYGKAVSMQTLRVLTDRVLQDPTMKQAAQIASVSLQKTGGYQQATDDICTFWLNHAQKAASPMLQQAISPPHEVINL